MMTHFWYISLKHFAKLSAQQNLLSPKHLCEAMLSLCYKLHSRITQDILLIHSCQGKERRRRANAGCGMSLMEQISTKP